MPNYVAEYLLPVPRKKLAAYRAMATTAAKIWREYGSLEYPEGVGEDLSVKWGMRFPRRFKLKAGELMVLSGIVSKWRAHRDRANRMRYGGFGVFVDL